jgi:hypothetical protein
MAATGGPMLVGQNYGVQMKPVPLNAVLYADDSMSRQVAVQSVLSARTDTQTVLVSARLVNCSAAPLVLRARTNFMNAGGASEEPVSAWRLIHLPSRATTVYEEKSVSTRVENFLIELAKE